MAPCYNRTTTKTPPPTMAITTLTIEQLCQQEEANNPNTEWKQERHDWLCQEMDAMSGLAELTMANIGYDRIPEYDRPQLVCEAIKFLNLRLAGYSFKDAVEIMVGSAPTQGMVAYLM